MNSCTRETCFVPDTGCDLGHTNLSNCPLWHKIPRNEAPADDLSDEVLLPWSGSALGLADLGFVSGRARPIVIGVVGAQNAGKTTLLGAWYLLLGRGLADLCGRWFAGSYSLSGWEAVASAMRWAPGHSPRFPPHTTSRGGRAPGMLHLALRDENQSGHVDYLFTDAPGEWFQKWAVNTNSQEGIGARWISDHADAFLVVADREALSGDGMGSARGSLQLLSRRLGSEVRNRPVALVWTKADVEIAPEMAAAVRKAVFDAMPNAAEFSVSVVNESEGDPALDKTNGLVDLLRWAVDVQRSAVKLPAPTATSNDPLFIYGARRK